MKTKPMITIVTTKGRVALPSSIRKRLHIRKGTKLCVFAEGQRIVLQPLTPDYFEKMAGILGVGGNLTRLLLDERVSEKNTSD